MLYVHSKYSKGSRCRKLVGRRGKVTGILFFCPNSNFFPQTTLRSQVHLWLCHFYGHRQRCCVEFAMNDASEPLSLAQTIFLRWGRTQNQGPSLFPGLRVSKKNRRIRRIAKTGTKVAINIIRGNRVGRRRKIPLRGPKSWLLTVSWFRAKKCQRGGEERRKKERGEKGN